MSDAKLSITFFSKTKTECPACHQQFRKEEMMTGSGRLNAGDLTEELRRLYIPSKKYGYVNPLIYHIVVCPKCLFAASMSDFTEIKDERGIDLKKYALDVEERIGAIEEIFPEMDFRKPRTIETGICSYYLAVIALESFPVIMSPSIKGGVYCIRTAWLCNDLHERYPTKNYDYLASIFYRKARFYYTKAMEGEQDGAEGIGRMKSPGPDLDKNYGYDGVLYISAYLQYKYFSKDGDVEKRKKSLENAKIIIAKIFGMGRASKNKPAAILDNAKELYEKIKKELDEIDQQ